MNTPNTAEYQTAKEVIQGFRTHANAKRVNAPTHAEEQFYYGCLRAYDKVLETLEKAEKGELQGEVYDTSEG